LRYYGNRYAGDGLKRNIFFHSMYYDLLGLNVQMINELIDYKIKFPFINILVIALPQFPKFMFN
jgi:hypothetical protein